MVPIYLDIDALPPVYDGQEAGLLDTLWSLNRIHIPYNSHPPPSTAPPHVLQQQSVSIDLKGKGLKEIYLIWPTGCETEILGS